MSKTRLQKEEMLKITLERIEKAKVIVFVNISGVKVGDLESIRDALFLQGLQLQVGKNSLLKLAFSKVKIEIPLDLLDQPLALVFSYDDLVAAAKISSQFASELEHLVILGGLMDKVYLSVDQIETLAKLENKEQLLTQLVGTLVAPLSGLISVLEGNIRGLVIALAQIRDQKV